MTKKSPAIVRSNVPELVVGIGASAGGVNAIRKLLGHLGEVTNIAFILVQHLDESGGTLAHEVLSHQTNWKVVEITDNMQLRGGVFYHSPPHANITIKKGVFKVEHTERRADQFAVIDTLFCSLAKDQDKRAVGIILSGEGSDGAQGVISIGDGGGMTLAQIPETADFPSMPRNAIATGAIDQTLPAEEMAKQITEYANYLTKMMKQKVSVSREISSALIEICEVLHKKTKHDFKHYKTSTLVRRIQRRMQVLQLSEVDSYVDRLNSEQKEADTLFQELLINVTCFFRDAEAFRTLKEAVLAPALKNCRSDQKYRVWIPGCSTGEEVYTIAILVREILAKMLNPPEVQIIATDIDETALNSARKGSYPGTISEHVSRPRLKRFFEKRGGRYVVKKELREIVLFSSHNLINDPPFSQLDLISCRNVMIYLGSHLQKKLIPVFHYALRSGGYLFLGTSESLTGHKELFKTTSAKHRIGQRKATSIRPPGFSTSLSHTMFSHPVESTKVHDNDIHLVSQRIILDEFAPKYAVVNDECQIVSISGGMDQFLGPSEGSFQNNLLKLVKSSLRVGLRSVFNEAKKQKRKVTHQNSTLTIDNELSRIGITVQPMPQLGDETGLFMVIFHYFGSVRTKNKVISETEPADTMVIDELERELSILRQDLDRSVQDLEASNEELKSSNEELISMNEELQSANEELEASKEDVQSANEALQRGNNDLENLLASTEIATLFLDDSLKIQSFTPQLASVFNVTKVDIGRPISHLTTLAKDLPPFYTTNEVIAAGGLIEHDLQMVDGRSLLLRISPYKTNDGLSSGTVATFIDISRIKTAEQAREESERRFQTMADSAPVLIWISGPDKLFNWFNKGWLEWTGKTMEQEIGNGWTEGLHPDDLQRCLDFYAENFDQRKEFYMEYRLRSKSGAYRWISDRGVPRYRMDGSFEGYVGGCMDIHDAKITQERLLDSQNRFGMMIRTSPSFMCLLRVPDYTVEEANQRFLQLVGHRQVTGKKLSLLLPDIQGQGFTEILAQVQKSGDPYIGTEVPIRLHQKAGDTETRYIDFVLQPDETKDGSIDRIFFHGNDVTEKFQVRAAIENERYNFRNLFKQTPEMVCILSGPQHIFEFVNEAHVKVLGFDATGQTVRQAQPESKEVHGILDEVFRTGVTAELKEIPVTLGSRVRYFNLTYSARRNIDNVINGVMILGTEVTEEIDNRAELLKAKAFAETANESKTRFLANISHEIRTPLSAILGYSELLHGRTKEGDEEAAIQLNRISRNAAQLGQLIDELLDLSKIEAEKLEIDRSAFNLRALFQDTISSVAVLADKKGIYVKYTVADDVPEEVVTDPIRFKQILINILGNAVKFTEKGQVSVEVDQIVTNESKLLRLRVRDTGIGLSEEQQKKIFEPFVQADASVTRKYGGTGLGLVLSTRLARLLGGDLNLEESTPHVGSVFCIYIDITQPADAIRQGAHSVATTRPSPNSNLLKGKDILVVDDSADNQTIIRLFLKKAGANVELADNGLEGVNKMKEKTYDLVLMDIQMPVMDGYQALRVTLQNGYSGKIVALSAHAMKEERDRCLKAGFTEYMSKPVDRILLVQRLNELTAQSN